MRRSALSPKCKKNVLETGVTLEDVFTFFDKNYPPKACKFLKAQLTLLNKAPRGSRYNDELKQLALSLYFLGPKAYKKFSEFQRLPSKSTLHRFMRNWVINPGFNEFIFKITELRVNHLNEKEKDCIICVDEMSIKSNLFYDIGRDKIIGFQESCSKNTLDIATSALVVMARGVACSWKHPIAYFFYKSAVPSQEIKVILFEAIKRLNATGLNVLGVVSDQGPNFQKLVKYELKISPETPYFFFNDNKFFLFF